MSDDAQRHADIKGRCIGVVTLLHDAHDVKDLQLLKDELETVYGIDGEGAVLAMAQMAVTFVRKAFAGTPYQDDVVYQIAELAEGVHISESQEFRGDVLGVLQVLMTSTPPESHVRELVAKWELKGFSAMAHHAHYAASIAVDASDRESNVPGLLQRYAMGLDE